MGTRGETERRDRRDALVLDDGTAVRFRAVEPGDARALQRLHARCSGRSIELRFFGPLGELPDKKAARLSRAEGADRLALAALDPDGGGEIAAVVRFERVAGGEAAEYAALVEGMVRLLRGLGLPTRRSREGGAERLEVDLGGPGGTADGAPGE